MYSFLKKMREIGERAYLISKTAYHFSIILKRGRYVRMLNHTRLHVLGQLWDAELNTMITEKSKTKNKTSSEVKKLKALK